MKVGSVLYGSTCSEWLHLVYSKYNRFRVGIPLQKDNSRVKRILEELCLIDLKSHYDYVTD